MFETTVIVEWVQAKQQQDTATIKCNRLAHVKSQPDGRKMNKQQSMNIMNSASHSALHAEQPLDLLCFGHIAVLRLHGTGACYLACSLKSIENAMVPPQIWAVFVHTNLLVFEVINTILALLSIHKHLSWTVLVQSQQGEVDVAKVCSILCSSRGSKAVGNVNSNSSSSCFSASFLSASCLSSADLVLFFTTFTSLEKPVSFITWSHTTL